MILWWRLSKMETLTPCLEITFCYYNIRSTHDKQLFTYKGDVRESISWPLELVISFFHNPEQRALKSLLITEHTENSSFIWLKSTCN